MLQPSLALSMQACTARVTIVALSVCLFVKSHLTSGASACHENTAMYSAGKEGRICGVLSETAEIKHSLPPMCNFS